MSCFRAGTALQRLVSGVATSLFCMPGRGVWRLGATLFCMPGAKAPGLAPRRQKLLVRALVSRQRSAGCSEDVRAGVRLAKAPGLAPPCAVFILLLHNFDILQLFNSIKFYIFVFSVVKRRNTS